ncbi:MAG TPA: hypothetical protein VER96_21800 [Polyangiaceae bacterium]|nr:hypothetical protein [Polyangiaceae bacterium]
MASRAPLACLWLMTACGGAQRYPLAAPIDDDGDRQPVSVSCAIRATEKDEKHVACAPEPYVSPLAWDAVDNSIFRPFARVWAVDPAGEAVNVNAFDEVPDSAWFENRIGKRKPAREALLRGACTPEEMLDPAGVAPGAWLIDQGKANGASAGFRIKIDGHRKYMLKTDVKLQPERPSASSVIGAAIYYAVGFNTSCEQIIYADPQVFRLSPGLKVTDNTGITKPFDRAALARVLDGATPRGPLRRLQASAWLPGYLIGPFRYEGTRSDDPNDVIPHEDRRDLRGARVLAAWLDHFDAREQNTMDSWIAVNSKANDSSPGFVRHYYLDMSDTLGSEWFDDGISRRLGHSYLLDWGDIATDFATLGTQVRPWDTVQRTPGMADFGYFNSYAFEPELWKNEYPNPAFSRASEHDNAWMARILSRFEDDDIRALVTLGRFSQAEHTAFVAQVLVERLQKILVRYLLRLSPLAELRVDGNVLSMVDLARRRLVLPASAFAYRARLDVPGAANTLHPTVGDGGVVALTLPHRSFARGVADGDPARYCVVTIANGASRYALRAYLYDLGAERGFRLVGIERPEQGFDELSKL